MKRSAGSPTPSSGRNKLAKHSNSSHSKTWYKDAIRSLKDNKYLKNLPVDDHYAKPLLRQVQSTYDVQISEALGYEDRLELIWDHDRLWGSFGLGFYSGSLLIDPGPSDVVPTKVPFKWRGTDFRDPEFNIVTGTGEINMFENLGEISGYFNSMFNPFKPDGCCEFQAMREFGPSLVARSLSSFIEDWNYHGSNLGEEHEKPRVPVLSHADSEEHKEEHSPSEEPDQPTEDNALTGIFNVSSNEIEDQWLERASYVSIRFHVDPKWDVVWGKFNMGICEGFLFLQKDPQSVKIGDKVLFCWRGIEDGTGEYLDGQGEVTFGENQHVHGIFFDVCGDIDFEGERNSMPSGFSGYTLRYYRKMWYEYDRDDEDAF